MWPFCTVSYGNCNSKAVIMKTLWEKIRAFRNSRKKYLVTLVLFVVVLALGAYSYKHGRGMKSIDYALSVDVEVARVNNTHLTLRDMAFYVAFEEAEVNKQALIYYPENPAKYWNVHTEGLYIRNAARNAAMQMAIHDELFYQMAVEEELSLNEEEEAILASAIEDRWADIKDVDADIKLGINKKDIERTVRKIALAEKMQACYAQLQHYDYEDWNYAADTYKAFLEKQDVRIEKELWKRVPFGNITTSY